MSAATHLYSPTAPIGHLSLGEWIERDEAEAVARHIVTIREYRAIMAEAKAKVAALESETLDRCLSGWDHRTILETMDDLVSVRLTDAEIQEMAIEAYWDGQKEFGV